MEENKMTYEDFVRRRWRFFIIYVVVGTMTVGLLFKILPKDIFKRNAICTKYAYQYLPIRDSIIKTTVAYSKEQAFRNYYYFHNLALGKETLLEIFGGAADLPVNFKVEVLAYSKDSLIVKIRYHVKTKLRGGMEYDEIGYVPFFMLHAEEYIEEK